MRLWRRFHALHFGLRGPLKLLAFLAITFLVFFPKPWLVPTWLQRLANMNSVLDPAHPGLADFERQARQMLPPEASAKDALATVEQVVYSRVPYAWDWDTWGVVDYLPTVAETLRMGREDCDGRAVVAASLLRRMGYQADIVSDILHVWVQTPEGDTMRPTSSAKTLVSTPEGTGVRITPALAVTVGRGLSYGVGAFPLLREIIILAAIALLSLHPWSPVWRRILGCLMVAVSLVLVRAVGIDAAMKGNPGMIAQAWTGFGFLGLGLLVLLIRTRAPRAAALDPSEPEAPARVSATL